MSKILVTGGTGYIGSHTVVELISAGHEVEILDNLVNSKASVVEKIEQITGVRPVLHEVDLLDYDNTREVMRRGFDTVMHFAGLKAVAESVEQPLKYYENNLVGTLNLLRTMQECKVQRLVFSSSATVYGDQGVRVLDETMQTGRGITNPYGQTKFMIEQILQDACVAEPGLSVVLLRYFNPVGAHESGLLGEEPNGTPNNLMPIVMKVATGELPELSIYGDDYDTPDGTCVRDYIHVVDLAQGHLAALMALEQPGASIYNLGTGKGTSVREMVAAFEEASGRPLPHRIVGRRAGDLAELIANPAKAEQELGWKATRTIDDAMRDTLNFLSRASA